MTTSAEGHIVIAAVQARTDSTRLPGKVLADLHGEPMIARIHERLTYAESLDHIVVATTTDPSDDELVEVLEERGIESVRGPVDRIAERLAMAGEACEADVVVRVWGDCPCVDPELVDYAVGGLYKSRDIWGDDAAATLGACPYGLNVETWWLEALQAVPRDDKTLQLYPRYHPRGVYFEFVLGLRETDVALTVDYYEDLERTRYIYDRLYSPDRPFTWREVLDLPDSILAIGQHHERNVEYKEAMGV